MKEVNNSLGHFLVKGRGYFGAAKHFIVYYEKRFVGAFVLPIYISPYFTMKSPERFDFLMESIKGDGDYVGHFLAEVPVNGSFMKFTVDSALNTSSIYLFGPPKKRAINYWWPLALLYFFKELRVQHKVSLDRLNARVSAAMIRDGSEAARRFKIILRRTNGDVSKVSSSLFAATLPVEEIYLEDYFNVAELEYLLTFLGQNQVLSRTADMSIAPVGESYREHLLETYGENGKECRYRYFNRSFLSFYETEEDLFRVDMFLGANGVCREGGLYAPKEVSWLFWKSLYKNMKGSLNM